MQAATASGWLKTQSKTAKGLLNTLLMTGILLALCIVAQAALLAQLIWQCAIAKTWPSTDALLLLLFIILLRALLTWGKTQLAQLAGNRVRSHIRNHFMVEILAKGPVASLRLSSGELSSHVVEHIEALHSYFSQYLTGRTFMAVVPLIILTCIVPVNWLSALVLLLCAPLLPMFMAFVGMGAKSISDRYFASLNRLSAQFLDTLKGLCTLKLFGATKHAEHRIHKLSHRYREETIAVLKIAFLSSAVLEFFSAGSIALIATLLGLTLLGHIDMGTAIHGMGLEGAIFILLLAPEFFMPLRDFASFYHAKADALAAAQGLMKHLETPNSTPRKSNHQIYSKTFNTLAFEGIGLRYHPQSPWVLKNFDLNIRAKERIAIIGPSGIGKSSLLQLLMGFVQTQEGGIKLNGQSIAHFNSGDWQKKLGVLKQKTHVFSGTLAENCRLGQRDLSDTKIIQALERMGLADEIMARKKGINSPVYENNQGLSAGQAQRLALARLSLQNPDILLLDEPTAHLDPETATFIESQLWRLAEGKTLIWVTHRHLDWQRFDRVLDFNKEVRR